MSNNLGLTVGHYSNAIKYTHILLNYFGIYIYTKIIQV